MLTRFQGGVGELWDPMSRARPEFRVLGGRCRVNMTKKMGGYTRCAEQPPIFLCPGGHPQQQWLYNTM